jgi:hypothetical protein
MNSRRLALAELGTKMVKQVVSIAEDSLTRLTLVIGGRRMLDDQVALHVALVRSGLPADTAFVEAGTDTQEMLVDILNSDCNNKEDHAWTI